MNVKIGTEAAHFFFLGILYLFRIFGIVSLQFAVSKTYRVRKDVFKVVFALK
jgi:hypothetical protein